MIGALSITRPRAPGNGRKNRNEQQEKNACDLEPQNAADPAKGTQETGHAASYPACRAGCGLASRATPGRRIRSGGIARGAIG